MIALVEALLASRVRFCAWKSNEHLAAALAGETDLDVLVDRAHTSAFRAVVSGFPIKGLTPPRDGRHPATEHFLGLDEATGRLFHLHVQYRLVLGEKYVKSYTIPLERQYLGSVRLIGGVPVPGPDFELAILATRALLKYRCRDVVKDTLCIRSPGVPAETRAEISWLESRTSIADVRTALESADDVLPVGPICGFLEAIERTPRPGIELFRLRNQLRRELRPYRRCRSGSALIAYARGAWLRRRRLRVSPPDLRMMPVAGGATIAFVGSDGSGKSTMAGAIDSWLGWKLQTRVYYMGSKAPSHCSRALYVLFRALRRTHRTSATRFEDRTQFIQSIAGARDIVRALHCLSIGRDRARRYRRALLDARSGRVVIFDRFPLDSLSHREDHHRLFDGPEISSLLPAPLAPVPRALAAAEARLYGRFHLPEHMVMLQVDPNIAVARKPDHPLEVLIDKCDAFGALGTRAEASDGVDVSRVDANQPADIVLSDIKHAVWHVI